MKHYRWIAALAALLCIFTFITACAENSGEHLISYPDFLNSYSDNIIFINTNTGRSLLPLVFSSGNTEDEVRVYQLFGDILSCTVKTLGAARNVVYCNITLTAPDNLAYGDDNYRDFTTGGYHSYALMMSMHRSDDALVRYALVSAVNDALSRADTCEQQVGDYHMVCVRSGNSVNITFGWDRWAPVLALPETEAPAEEQPAEEEQSPEESAENNG